MAKIIRTKTRAEGGITDEERAKMAEHEWKPIETAPKDGTPLLVFDGYAITTAKWETEYEWWEICVPSDGHIESNCFAPTYWMPPPTAPNQEER